MSAAEEALTAWESACAEAHGGAARDKPLLTTARLIVAGDRLRDIVHAPGTGRHPRAAGQP